MRCLSVILFAATNAALAAAPAAPQPSAPPAPAVVSSPSNDLVMARRALGDGLWQIVERRAVSAAADPALRDEARLLQVEALARSNRDKELLALIDSWGALDTEPLRYWRARACERTGQFEVARRLLERPFADRNFAALAARLSARLAVQMGDRPLADREFRRASGALADDAAARLENALEWARALDAFGDAAAARTVLKEEKALDANGSAGDSARLLEADLLVRTGDASAARKLREKIVAGGDRTDAVAYVLAATELAETYWQTGDTNAALTVASNAVRRANRPELERLAGFALGFKELERPEMRTNGMARISSLVKAYPGASETSAVQFRFAAELLRLGDAAGALLEYDRLQNAYPQYALDARVFASRGWAFHQLSKYTEAVGAFARAALIATNAADRALYTFKQADELLAGGRYAEAAVAYAGVDAPDLVENARFQQADALQRAHQDEEAAKVFRRILDGAGPFAVSAGLRLAAAEAAAGRTESAISDYNRVLGVKEMSLIVEEDDKQAEKLKPLPPPSVKERVEALYGRGRAYYRVYRFAEAEKDFSAVAELAPARAGEMRFLKAMCRYGAGRDEEARMVALDLLKDTPESPLRADLVLWLAKFDYARRDFATARTGFEAYAVNAHATPIRRLEAYVRAARCAAAQADHMRAIELVSHAVTNAVAVAALANPEATPATPVVAEGLLVQGESLMELARFDEAVLVLDVVVRYRAAAEDFHRRAAILKADCRFALGADNSKRYEEALEAYRAVLQDEGLPPSMRLTVSFKIGRALEKLRRFEEAADQYYANVVMAYCDGTREKVWFDANARAFFARAAFILADWYESNGSDEQAARVLEYLVATGVPAAGEARKRIARLKRKGGF